MASFEYEVVRETDEQAFKARINALGQDGWDMVHASAHVEPIASNYGQGGAGGSNFNDRGRLSRIVWTACMKRDSAVTAEERLALLEAEREIIHDELAAVGASGKVTTVEVRGPGGPGGGGGSVSRTEAVIVRYPEEPGNVSL